MYVEYRSNNSGGDWWLSDDDWKALEAAGWVVVWNWMSEAYDDKGNYLRDEDTKMPIIVPIDENNSNWPSMAGASEVGSRWLGALARTAYRHGLPLEEAVAEWERVTGENSTDVGCPCCGQPHDFTLYDDEGKYVTSGPRASYSASW